ncbi:hypothetical protein F4802DRAFT_592366 [Xylaria palmicola]|nr:hypothetical protein F4802DRAFT_592366 [Xylaria palmicola]
MEDTHEAMMLPSDRPRWHLPLGSILPCDRLSVSAFIFSILLGVCECILQLLLFPALPGLILDAIGLGITIGCIYCLRQLNLYTWKYIQLKFSDEICIRMLQVVIVWRQEDLAAIKRSNDVITVIRLLVSEIPIFAVSLGQACHNRLGWFSVPASIALVSINILLRLAFRQSDSLEHIRETAILCETTFDNLQERSLQGNLSAEHFRTAEGIRQPILWWAVKDLTRLYSLTSFTLAVCCYLGQTLPMFVLGKIIHDIIALNMSIEKLWKKLWVVKAVYF